MELRQLEYLSAVARHGHFGRAADATYVTQSALSQQIRRLEEELGLPLFVRTPKGAKLTPAGAELVEHAEAILSQVAEARALIDDHVGAAKGVVRIAATGVEPGRIATALATFHRAHRGIQIMLRHGAAREVAALIDSATVDLAVAAVHDAEATFGSDVSLRIVSEEPLRLILPGGDARAGRTDVTMGELRGQPAILPERGTALREAVNEASAAVGFSPVPLLEASDPATIRHLVDAGLGVSVVPASWLAAAEPRVGVADFADPVPTYRTAVATHAAPSPAARLLAEHLAGALAGPDR